MPPGGTRVATMPAVSLAPSPGSLPAPSTDFLGGEAPHCVGETATNGPEGPVPRVDNGVGGHSVSPFRRHVAMPTASPAQSPGALRAPSADFLGGEAHHCVEEAANNGPEDPVPARRPGGAQCLPLRTLPRFVHD